MPSLYLASASPRRRELLTQIGVPLSVLATAIDESPLPNEAPAAYVERLARGKAAAGLAMLEGRGEDGYVLGADTSVVIDGRILGKPVDQAEGWPCWLRCPGANTRFSPPWPWPPLAASRRG